MEEIQKRRKRRARTYSKNESVYPKAPLITQIIKGRSIAVYLHCQAWKPNGNELKVPFLFALYRTDVDSVAAIMKRRSTGRKTAPWILVNFTTSEGVNHVL